MEVPAVVGVPDSTPADVSVRLAGSAPDICGLVGRSYNIQICPRDLAPVLTTEYQE